MTRLFGLWSENLQRFLRDQHGAYLASDYRQAEYVRNQIVSSLDPDTDVVIKEFYPADPLAMADFITIKTDTETPSIKENTYGK